MNTHRYYASGPVTNYEMGNNRNCNVRRARWLPIWAGVSNPVHVNSLAEWVDLQSGEDEDPLTTAE